MIIGHQKIINFLNKSLERNIVNQAYLFSGPEHLGKFTVAFDFAKKITGDGGKRINPDIVLVAPEIEDKKGVLKKKDIKVEQIRELQKELSLTPSGKGMKVAIIDEADRLTLSAQNALLKTLEEPNGKAVIILVCHDTEKILATIKSRCLIKNFNPVGEGEMRKNSLSTFSEEIIFWSSGRPGLALELSSNQEKIKSFKKYQTDLTLISEGNVAEKFALAEELSKDAPRITEELKAWTMLLRQNFLFGKTLGPARRKKAFLLIDEIAEVVRVLRETNSNARVVLENLFLKF